MLKRSPGRVRFQECEIDEHAGSRHRARVVLADGDERTFTGMAERAWADDGDIWSAAEATVEALRQVLGLGPDVLRLKEVVAFDMADSQAVAVSLRVMVEGQKRRLFGLSQAEDDRGRAAALAVLAATNRFLGAG